MIKTFPHRVGVTVGAFSGLVHLLWSVLMALELAPKVMAWKMAIHGVSMDWSVTEFMVDDALILIVVGLISGYVAGYVIGAIWEKTA